MCRPRPHAGRRAAGGGDRLVRHGRSRTDRATEGGNRGLQVHRAADAHRVAQDPSPHRQVPRREPDDRRPARRRSSVLHRPAAGGVARLDAGHRPPAGHHDYRRRDDRLAHAGREVGERAQLPAVQPRRREAAGPATRHDDPQIPAGVPRAVHVRRSRNAVGHRLPQSGHQHRQPPQLPRDGDVHGRNGHDPGLRADVGEHEGAVRHRRLAHPSRARRPRHRRGDNGRARRGGRGALAQPGLPGPVARQVPAHAGAVFQERTVADLRRRRLHRHVPVVQERRKKRHQPRSHGHVLERACRRERVSISISVRIAAVDAARVRGLERRLAVLRRGRAVRIFDPAVR